jgi:hypothetical protein
LFVVDGMSAMPIAERRYAANMLADIPAAERERNADRAAEERSHIFAFDCRTLQIWMADALDDRETESFRLNMERHAYSLAVKLAHQAIGVLARQAYMGGNAR